MDRFLDLESRYGVRNYHPLPVVLSRGRGVHVYDVGGRRYLDMLSAYSALNQGHCHPRIIAAAKRQLGRLTLASRAFHTDLLGPLLKRLCALTRMQRAILMNSGAEAVETAIKAARLWGYRVKGIPDGRAVILAAENNFHGRTTTIVGFSSDAKSRAGFGPATPGFRLVPFGSAAALDVVEDERLPQKAAQTGRYFLGRLKTLRHPKLKEVRGLGLLLALEFTEPLGRRFCELLLKHGVLAKDSHDFVVRLAPPLIITRKQVDEALKALAAALREL